MANSNGNGVVMRWAVGGLLLLVVAWLGFLSQSSADHATHAEVTASEGRVEKRLDRIESKVDRLLERR